MRMWDRDAAVEVMKVVAHTGPVASLAASLVPECCMVSCGIDGVLHLWKTDDLVCLRSVRPPMPSELTRAQEALKQLMDQEEKARWAATQVELEGQLAQLDEDGSPHSPISTASVSPADAASSASFVGVTTSSSSSSSELSSESWFAVSTCRRVG